MKRITIELNTESINEARKYLLNLKKQIPKMEKEFLEGVAKWIVKQADGYIDRADLGSAVKSEIKRNWHYEETTNGVKIINNTNVERKVRGQTETVPLAVLVEFGVGVVGESQPHPNSNQEGYEYNIPSPSKYAGNYHDDDTWRFITYSIESIDLPQDSYETWQMGSGALKIITKGAKGVWYAYNAIVDAQAELAKANGGEIGKMWEDIKARYIK
jgi:hypothetical protein